MKLNVVPRMQSLITQRIDRWFPGAKILIYHRVTELAHDPQLLAVHPDHFAGHLEEIRKKNWDIVDLQVLISALRSGEKCDNLVAITFDDGYADNFLNANPILEKYAAPATVFVTTKKVDTQVEFWWDELERIFLDSAHLPDELYIEAQKRLFHFLGFNSKEKALNYRGWNVLNEKNLDTRQKAYLSFCDLFNHVDSIQRNELLILLREWAGLSETGRPCNRALTATELKRFSFSGLVNIGSHTCSHSHLAQLSEGLQIDELFESKKFLESCISQPINRFSYPFGGRKDYSANTARLVKQAGYELACSNFPGRIRKNVDQFQLPRFIVRDWDRKTFRDNLARW
jgi:peptidoglycan/xylan/chitin deacetylase (PgdA/CDA1 family)